MSKRYAEGTTVGVEKSVEDLRRLSVRYGAEEFTYAISPRQGAVMFRLDGIPLRYDVAFPTGSGMTVKQAEAEWRRRWRVVLLRAKGQFEAHLDGEESVTRAFLSNVLLPDGSTVGDQVDAIGIGAFDGGGFLPALTAGGGA
jgi:hypothetical protein